LFFIFFKLLYLSDSILSATYFTMLGIFKKIFFFYYDWFRNLSSTSKKLWILIIIKSTIILTVLFLFFPNVLDKYKTEDAKASFVADNLLP